MRKLFHKNAALAADASLLFRSTPYVLFGTMVLAAAIIPSIATDLPFARAADSIALIGLFATARVFQSLAAMDIGTAFRTLGSRREMMIGFLAEPALLMVLFNAFLLFGSTSLPSLVDGSAAHSSVIDPKVIFAAVAFVMVLLAENGRIPIDNPTTHLELTMIHEALVLEYSARHLALVEWAASLKLFNYACIGFALFLPWGIATRGADSGGAVIVSIVALIGKLLIAGAALALGEALSAKLRIFRAPEYLAIFVPACRAGTACSSPAGGLKHMQMPQMILGVLKLLASGLLLISFSLLSQRRTQRLITLFAWQGTVLFVSTLLVAVSAGLKELYYSAALILVLKVIALPAILRYLIRRLGSVAEWDSKPLVSIPTTMLSGLALVLFAFGLAQPICRMATTITRNTLRIALAVILLSFLMMITRRKAVTQVIGFLAM